jgi:hypothetical protein
MTSYQPNVEDGVVDPIDVPRAEERPLAERAVDPASRRLRQGDRIEHDDGHVWCVTGASTCTVDIRMPDGQHIRIGRAALDRQLADEPVRVVRSD